MKQNLLKSPINRIIIALLLLSVLIGLCFYYNNIYESNAKYPSAKSILTNYTQGEIVFISGDFAGTYDSGFYILNNFQNKKTIYKINSSYNATEGDIVSLIGVLGPSFTINNPQQIVINKKWKEDFLLYRSALIGIILLLLFWRYWKFDFRKMQFYRRK